MIQRITLRDFKGVKKGTIDLSRFTVLTGGNNTGKSTILEAIFLLPNPLRNTPYGLAATTLQELHSTLESRSLLFLLHNYTAEKAQVTYSTDKGEVTLDFWKDNSKMLIALRLGNVPTTVIGWLTQREHELYNEGKPGEVLDAAKSRCGETLYYSPKLTGKAWEFLRGSWVKVAGQATRMAAEFTSRLVSEKYTDITLEPLLEGELSMNLYEEGKRVRLGDVGSGVQHVITVILLHAIVAPQVLLWDDVEASMNPRLLYYTLEWLIDLAKQGTQVILATQSIDVVRTASIMLEDVDWATIQLLKLENGELKAKPHTPREAQELAQAGIDIRTGDILI